MEKFVLVEEYQSLEHDGRSKESHKMEAPVAILMEMAELRMLLGQAGL